MTFLAYFDTGAPGPSASISLEWSYNGATDWIPIKLAGVFAISLDSQVLRRITVDDVFTYLRLTVTNTSGVPGTLSAWLISM